MQQSQPDLPLTIPSEAEQHLIDAGWETFVRVRDHEQQVSLWYKPINDRMSGVYVVVLNQGQLVVVEIQGRLDKLIEKALQEQGIPESFEMI
jgi:hypothetical protein